MKKVRIRLAYWPREREVYVNGYEVAPGLVAHREVSCHSNWQLTHAVTGLLVHDDYFTLREAMAAAKRVSELLDFEKMGGEFGKNPKWGFPARWREEYRKLLAPENS